MFEEMFEHGDRGHNGRKVTYLRNTEGVELPRLLGSGGPFKSGAAEDNFFGKD
jgi:hypothetical protein